MKQERGNSDIMYINTGNSIYQVDEKAFSLSYCSRTTDYQRQRAHVKEAIEETQHIRRTDWQQTSQQQQLNTGDSEIF